MKIVTSKTATSGAASPATILRSLAQRWQVQSARLFGSYRPELHYMRGPGPKWREKHGLPEQALQ